MEVKEFVETVWGHLSVGDRFRTLYPHRGSIYTVTTPLRGVEISRWSGPEMRVEVEGGVSWSVEDGSYATGSTTDYHLPFDNKVWREVVREVPDPVDTFDPGDESETIGQLRTKVNGLRNRIKQLRTELEQYEKLQRPLHDPSITTTESLDTLIACLQRIRSRLS